MVSLPEWSSYLDLLARIYERHAAKLKSGLEYGDYRHESGAVAAIEEIANIADQVVLKREELHDRTIRTERERADAESRKSDALHYTHWNTPR